MGIRSARSSDLEEIVAIYNQAIEERATGDTVPVSVGDRAGWLDDYARAGRPVLVAESEGVVLGWASLSAYRAGRGALRHTAELSYYVSADHRREGVASGLIQHCIEAGAAGGLHTLFAIVLDDNLPSIRLLERHGFERWGHLPRVARFDGVEVGHLYYGRRIDEV